MKVHEAGPDAARVAAASLGDPAAVEEVVAAGLPVVRSVVRSVLGRHPDVDDVVQEAMVRAVRGLPGLRDPDRFRSWLVTVALREARTWARAHRGHDAVDVLPDLADPTDVADLAVTRTVLAGERRELAAAVRWLDPEDRRTASLWWLEATGALSRPEVVEAAGTSAHATAVRVHRMRARLDDARRLVRALAAEPRCPDLDRLARRWDGRPASVWRKRFNRHVAACTACGGSSSTLTPAEMLALGLAAAPPSALIAAQVVARLCGPAAPAAATASAAHAPGVLRALARAGSTKPALVAATVTVAAAVATPVVLQQHRPRTVTVVTAEAAPAPAPATSGPLRVSPTATPTVAPTAVLPASPPATHVTASRPAPSRTAATPAGPRYGSVVDTADAAPPAGRTPRRLPRRPEGPAVRAVGGSWAAGRPGWIGGDFVMMNNSQSVVLRGRGYFQVRYEIAYFNAGRTGELVMPTWVGLRGRLFHVASGGWRRMDDPLTPGDPTAGSWMGTTTQGFITLPRGAQQMWQNEFFYLDGEVTLHNNEGGADYNLAATPRTWQQVVDDVTAPRPAGTDDRGWRRYGLVRDTGDDGAPVPQYLTRSTPAEPWKVPQRSKVS